MKEAFTPFNIGISLPFRFLEVHTGPTDTGNPQLMILIEP